MAGCLVVLGVFTFSYGRGFSYLGDDPKTCTNCHVMRDVYDAWNHGSHKAVATCNDCHLPHSSLVAKYLVKSKDGWHHSYAFTTNKFHEPIVIKKPDADVAQQNCLRCHGELTSSMNHKGSREQTDCLRCHAGVGHSH